MKLRDKLNELRATKAEYHEKAPTLTPPEVTDWSQKIRAIHQEIQDILTEGAKDCSREVEVPTYDEATGEQNGTKTETETYRPLAVFHDGTPNPFEIGDPRVRDKRVRAALPEDAVEKWNNDEYLPPRPAGFGEATIRSVDGEVREQKLVRVRTAKAK